MNVSNKIIISAIRNFIQNDKDLIPLLMSLLNLGKQSVYRRLRDEIPFTFEEVTILSSKIGFSVDEIMSKLSRDNEDMDMSTLMLTEPKDLYTESRRRLNQLLENTRKHNNSSLIAATNRLPFIFTATYENISKMEYYKWYLQYSNNTNIVKFEDFKVPSSMISDSKSIFYNCSHINNQTLILDHNLLKPIIKEINYYYKRELISEEELSLLREELMHVVNDLESLAINGRFKSGSEINIYLSSLSISSNCVLLEYEYSACFIVWFNALGPISVFNHNICSVQKDWLLSLKRYSTLITQCNEFSRSVFFNKQRELIMKMQEEAGVYL